MTNLKMLIQSRCSSGFNPQSCFMQMSPVLQYNIKLLRDNKLLGNLPAAKKTACKQFHSWERPLKTNVCKSGYQQM